MWKQKRALYVNIYLSAESPFNEEPSNFLSIATWAWISLQLHQAIGRKAEALTGNSLHSRANYLKMRQLNSVITSTKRQSSHAKAWKFTLFASLCLQPPRLFRSFSFIYTTQSSAFAYVLRSKEAVRRLSHLLYSIRSLVLKRFLDCDGWGCTIRHYPYRSFHPGVKYQKACSWAGKAENNGKVSDVCSIIVCASIETLLSPHEPEKTWSNFARSKTRFITQFTVILLFAFPPRERPALETRNRTRTMAQKWGSVYL